MNILVVEDERSLAKELQHFLEKEHYLCEVANTGRDASEKIAVTPYDFILLDLGLPDYDGLDLLQEARQDLNSEAAVIILSARGAVEDRVNGLNLGADDYLPKPFSLLELHSRMQAIVRRKFGIKSKVVPLSAFEVDINSREVLHQGQAVTLTKKEFDLLSYMLLHKSRVLTRLQLSEHIWGNILEDDYDSNYIDVHIKNIRKKLSVHSAVDWLETVRGVGYRISL